MDVLRPRRRVEFNAIDPRSTICVLYTKRASLSRTPAYAIVDITHRVLGTATKSAFPMPSDLTSHSSKVSDKRSTDGQWTITGLRPRYKIVVVVPTDIKY